MFAAELALTDAPADAHELLARVALARNELALAEREAAGVSGSPSLDARGAVLRAEVRLRQNGPSDALRILDGALSKLDPAAREQIGNAQVLRGDSLARLNRYPEAEQPRGDPPLPQKLRGLRAARDPVCGRAPARPGG